MSNLTELFQQIVLHTDRYGLPRPIDGSSLEMLLARGKTKSACYLKCYPSGFCEQVIKVWDDSKLVFQATTVTRTPALEQEEKNLAVFDYKPGTWEEDFLKRKLVPPY